MFDFNTVIIEIFEKNILTTDRILTFKEFKKRTSGLIGTDNEWYRSYLDYFINY